MVEEITPDELKHKLDDGEAVQVVDIRPAEAFATGHIPGATNIPFDRLVADIDRHDWGEDIVVACPVGRSSVQAARLIGTYEGVESPARVKSLRGGYEAWEYDLEAADDR